MSLDPFEVKQHVKWHPRRLWFTLRARLEEISSRRNFETYGLPKKRFSNLPDLDSFDINYDNTAVTPLQMQHLIALIDQSETLQQSVIAEVGAFRGETTACMAAHTNRTVLAVDPYIGYGGAESDKKQFKAKTADLDNVQLINQTSGKAFRSWSNGPVSIVFIDAVHDYVNTSFDIACWGQLLVNGGFMALHDTDNIQFAGTRRAAFEAAQSDLFKLVAHVDNLVVLERAG